MIEKLELMEKRYEEIIDLISRDEVLRDPLRLQELGREKAELEEVLGLYRRYKKVLRDLEDAEALLKEDDDEIKRFAREEKKRLENERERLEEEIKIKLLPKDPYDERDVIVEIRAGAGGEEACLFSADLFRMYTRYALSKGWEIEVLSKNETGLGGFKEIIFEVKGRGAYSKLKYERGVHRVQRIPITESGGRIHTSTVTVAVLPKPDEIEINIKPEDLKIETFRAQGAGGQHVNKVSTAVRITHLPTGITVSCQDERSQYRNKVRALSILRARLFDMERKKRKSEIDAERRAQVGTGERAEKIRTYNFQQGRVSDHRIDLTIYNLESILDGELDQLIEPLMLAEREKLLEEKVG